MKAYTLLAIVFVTTYASFATDVSAGVGNKKEYVELSFNIKDGELWFDADGITCGDTVNDKMNSCNTYVIVKIDGKQVYRTKEKYDTVHPVFDEIFKVGPIKSDAVIEFEMWDSDAGYFPGGLKSRWSGPAEYYLKRYTLFSDTIKDGHRNSLYVTTELVTQEKLEEYVELSFDIKDGEAWLDIDGDTCDNLTNNQINPCDTYVIVKINGKQVYRTKEAQNTAHPVFNEVFKTGLIRSDAVIEFEMWDSDGGHSADDLMSKWSGTVEYYLKRYTLVSDTIKDGHRNSLVIVTELLANQKWGEGSGFSVGTCSDSISCSGYSYKKFINVNDIRNSVPEGYRLRLVVYVNGPHDGHVLLSSAANDKSDVYEIVLGGWRNTQSVIRKKCQGKHLATSKVQGVMHPTPQKIAIEVTNDGYVRVFTETKRPLMEYRDPNPTPINFVSFSGFESNVKFQYNCGPR